MQVPMEGLGGCTCRWCSRSVRWPQWGGVAKSNGILRCIGLFQHHHLSSLPSRLRGVTIANVLLYCGGPRSLWQRLCGCHTRRRVFLRGCGGGYCTTLESPPMPFFPFELCETPCIPVHLFDAHSNSREFPFSGPSGLAHDALAADWNSARSGSR